MALHTAADAAGGGGVRRCAMRGAGGDVVGWLRRRGGYGVLLCIHAHETDIRRSHAYTHTRDIPARLQRETHAPVTAAVSDDAVVQQRGASSPLGVASRSSTPGRCTEYSEERIRRAAGGLLDGPARRWEGR